MAPKLVTAIKLDAGVVITEHTGSRGLAAIFDNQEQAHEWLGARNYILARQERRDAGDLISGTYVRLGGVSGRAS